ncbi:MAG: hypothetical protein V4633_07560 [Pseudomonadota bacterium]
MTYSFSVDKRQTLTLLFHFCCAIETTINRRATRQLDHAQLFHMELFVLDLFVPWENAQFARTLIANYAKSLYPAQRFVGKASVMTSRVALLWGKVDLAAR